MYTRHSGCSSTISLLTISHSVGSSALRGLSCPTRQSRSIPSFACLRKRLSVILWTSEMFLEGMDMKRQMFESVAPGISRAFPASSRVKCQESSRTSRRRQQRWDSTGVWLQGLTSVLMCCEHVIDTVDFTCNFLPPAALSRCHPSHECSGHVPVVENALDSDNFLLCSFI